MADYVSRDDVHRFITKAFTDNRIASNYDFAILVDKIDEIPAADVQPICHGRWENIRNVKLIDAIKRCECNQCHNKIYGGLSYCGNCGARMDGDVE